MRCPTCDTELAPAGACPRCARPPLVPPTPVLAAGAVATAGTDEYPLGLPYSLAEIRQACAHHILLRMLWSYSLPIFLIAVKLLFFGYFMIRFFNRFPGEAAVFWFYAGLLAIGIGVMLIGGNIVPLIVPIRITATFAAVVNILVGTLLFAAVLTALLLQHSVLTHGGFAVYAAIPAVLGVLQLRECRNPSIPRERPARALRRVLHEWLRSLHRTRSGADEDTMEIFIASAFTAQLPIVHLRMRRMGEYLLLVMSQDVTFLHIRDVQITTGTAVFGTYLRATVACGALNPMKALITPEHFARYQRWCETSAPSASRESYPTLPNTG